MYYARVACVAFLSAIGAGCSSSSYEKQVTELSAGFTKVTASFQSLVEDERQAFVRSQTRIGLTSDHFLSVPGTCTPERIEQANRQNKSDTVDCRAQVITISNGAQSGAKIIVFDPAAPKGLELAKKMAAYGEGLVILTTAKDVAELKEGVAKASAAIVKLRAVVEPKAPAEPFGAITSAGVWAIGKLLDAQRVEQLKRVVAEADDTVADAASLLARQARLAQRSILTQRAQFLSHDQVQIRHLREGVVKNPDAGDATLVKAADDFVVGSLSLQTFAKTDIGKPFASMREAHANLLHALKNPELPPDLVFAQLGEFIDQVDKLNSAIEAARKG